MNIVRGLLLATLISENAVAQLTTYKHLRVLYGTSLAQRVDVYTSSRAGAPTIVGIHGGGWSNIGAYPQSYGSEDYLSELAPFFALGWTVMNVEYRGSETAAAPAALNDVRCGIARAATTTPVYLMGHSAGGHLALMTAALSHRPLPDECATLAPLQVLGVINWYGISDVLEIMDRDFAVNWFNGVTNAGALALQLSPIFNMDSQMPPVITIHGIGDPVVPFSQSSRLHAELSALGVRNRLVPINVNTHGNFDQADLDDSWSSVIQFINSATRRRAARH